MTPAQVGELTFPQYRQMMRRMVTHKEEQASLMLGHSIGSEL